MLKVGGVAAIISFHSLEDRKVKEGFRDLAGRCRCPRDLPVCACGAQGSFSVKTRKAISPSEAEVRRRLGQQPVPAEQLAVCGQLIA